MRPFPLLLLLPSLAACASMASAGHWTGITRPEGAGGPPVAAEICDGPTRATLDVHDGHFVLAPNQGVLVLPGTVSPSGALAAKLALHPANHTATTLTFTGQIQGDVIHGTLTTPRCRATLTLHRGETPGWFNP